ncbi:MAG: group II intron reverse transcriptase/maturase [Enterocloster clostridioformis]|jgi:group II intron reverse transcriptase/maturase|uniref:group II intron reverse transcriptase/maturase n=1 Tax=Enterocloster clostridioformis TaxID=1531 RepID=UPI00241DBBC3|nr:group II intron reverse transcriptase/maturase [Enterocloster clostridioformis]MBE7715037.1 group II intron reverse transcriptase/maturase [Enterocloster clostridioformis]
MPVLTSKQQEEKSKQRKIRNSEYYDMQKTFDRLYADSRKGKVFNHLMETIESEENIKLAYRTIKKNTGSNTAGVDKRTIKSLAKLSEKDYVRLIRKQFSNYHPRPVRRVEIPKPNGKTRPLGIPTIIDRVVQQCVMQVMEPICEARFSDNSYGFRPNRSTEHAIAQCMRLIQVQHMYHVVDLDIKGFFDNINHTKLIRQIWALGIRDKKLLCIIKEMLKAPVILPTGEKVYPQKGTPQGGILSPLLANIVLNELDWWIASQWEQMPTKTEFKTKCNEQGTEIRSHAYRALRRSRLKEVHAVRYADDFKIFCPTHEDAVKAYKATEMWLKDRLGLDISPDKSKVVNLKRQYSEFLGFKLKVRKKGKKYVVRSHMNDKAYKKAHEKLTGEIKELAHSSDDTAQFIQLQKYNSVVAGLHEYYRIATDTVDDFAKLAFSINKQLNNRLKGDVSRKGTLRNGFIKDKYGKSKQLRFLHERPIVPVGAVQQKNAQNKRKSINKYTAKGRELIHKNLAINTEAMLYLMRNPVMGRSIEYADNRISLFAAQYGKCAITGLPMEVHEIHCHHKVPVSKGGTDEYANLILITEAVHVIIHATSETIIKQYLNNIQLDDSKLEKLNKLRTLAEMPPIIL